MRQLEDKETGLIWVIPEVDTIMEQGTPLFQKDRTILEEFTKELNEYSSPAISKFVTADYAKLGTFIEWAVMGKKEPCYCFEDGKLVATALINPNNALGHRNELLTYIKYCESTISSHSNGLPGYISYKKAKQLLKSISDDNNASIDYLVVIPPAQNKGIGTRAVHSITHNMDFFAPNKTVTTIDTQIHKANKPSQAIFTRADFGKYALLDTELYTPLEDYVKSI